METGLPHAVMSSPLQGARAFGLHSLVLSSQLFQVLGAYGIGFTESCPSDFVFPNYSKHAALDLSSKSS